MSLRCAACRVGGERDGRINIRHSLDQYCDLINGGPAMAPEPILADCPHESGPYHFWEVDGPFTVTCAECGAEGRITITEGGGA
jgi:hypothetical protein